MYKRQLWDRLFGTFQPEDDAEPVVFGVTTPLASWNPLWANLQFYAQLWNDARRAERWQDKLRIWFMPTGWRPEDVARRYPQAGQDLANFRKFEVPLAWPRQLYVLLQFAVYVALGSHLMESEAQLPLPALLLGALVVGFGLFVLGAALENRPWAFKLELLRLASNLLAFALAGWTGLGPVTVTGWVALLAYSLLSLIGLAMSRFLPGDARGLEAPAQPQAAAEHQQTAEHP